MEITDRSEAKFVADLVRESPTIERISKNRIVIGPDGEVMVHILFAMATPYLQELADRSLLDSQRKQAAMWGSPPVTDGESRRELMGVLGQLERWYEPDDLPATSSEDEDRVTNAIALSFIEGLPPLGEPSPIVELLGRKLRQSHERFWREGFF
jgi:hypothetical protein